MERESDESPLLFPNEHIRENQRANSNCEHESVPEVRLSRKKLLVVICILFVELCERLTYYGVAANLIFYCKDVLNLASPLPSTIALAFQGKFKMIEGFYNRTSFPLGQSIRTGMCYIILGVALRWIGQASRPRGNSNTR